MMKNARNAILILTITAIISGSLIFLGSLNQVDVKTQFEPQYTFVKASTHSPIITINEASPNQLMMQAQELNTTTIYDTNMGYMIIDFDLGIGYIYHQSPTWFGLNETYTLVSLLPVILGGCLIFFWDNSKKEQEK